MVVSFSSIIMPEQMAAIGMGKLAGGINTAFSTVSTKLAAYLS